MTLAALPSPNYTGSDLSARLGALLTRARGHIDVRDYGVTGDGSANDAAALQAAFAALEDGGTLDFGALSIRSLAKITISGRSRITLRGHGARYLPSAQPAEIEFTACEDVTVEGIIFDGRDLCSSGLVFMNCRNTKARGCTFRNFSNAFTGVSYGLVANTTSGATGTWRSGLHVTDCTFDSIDRDGLQTKSVDDVTVTGCTFYNMGERGIDAHAYDATVPVGDGMTVTGNVFDGCAVAAIGPGVKNMAVGVNVVRDSGAAIYLVDESSGVIDGLIGKGLAIGIHAINGRLGDGIDVKNCTLECSNAHVKIHDSGANTLKLTVEGNRFIGTPSSNHIDIRRSGGTVILRGNDYEAGRIYLADEGAAALTWIVDERVAVSLADAGVSGALTRFLSNANFGGVLVTVRDMTAFDPAFCGSAGYADVSPPSSPVAHPDKGAALLFVNAQPSGLSAGNVRCGPNNSGQFVLRNDSGATKRLELRVQKG